MKRQIPKLERRIRILKMLEDGPMQSCELSGEFGDIGRCRVQALCTELKHEGLIFSSRRKTPEGNLWPHWSLEPLEDETHEDLSPEIHYYLNVCPRSTVGRISDAFQICEGPALDVLRNLQQENHVDWFKAYGTNVKLWVALTEPREAFLKTRRKLATQPWQKGILQ